MKRALALLALLVVSCGEPAAGVGVPLALDLRSFAPGEAGAVQIAVLANGDRYRCEDLRRTCLSKLITDDLVSASDLVPVRDGEDGAEKRSFRRMLDGLSTLEGAAGLTFDLVLEPGKNYLVVVEIISADAPTLKASGCASVTELKEGDNPAVAVQPLLLASAPACDPRID